MAGLYDTRYYRHHPLETVRKAAKAILEHLFDNHQYCDAKWCKPLRIQQANEKKNSPPSIGGFASHPLTQANPPSHANPSALRQPTRGSDDALAPGGPSMSPTNAPSKTPADRDADTTDAAGPAGRCSLPPLPQRPAPPATPAANPPSTPTEPVKENIQKGYYRCKVRHFELYMQLLPIWEKLTEDERLIECMHGFSSQCNEGLNTAVAKYARKGRTYCTTMSLTNRVMIAMGVHNLGYFVFWSRVFSLCVCSCRLL